MIPELSKENADRWFNDVRETLKAKRLWWIIMEPETANDITHAAISALLRRIVPKSQLDLLDENREPAASQFHAFKNRWQALRLSAVRQKIAAFYNYKKAHQGVENGRGGTSCSLHHTFL
jgi:hypothetical protein